MLFGIAINEVADIDFDRRTFFLLEGMPVAEMALDIFKLKGYAYSNKITNLKEKVSLILPHSK
jgi:hypothetical protein